MYTQSALSVIQMLNISFRLSIRYPLDPQTLHYSAVHSKRRVTCSEYNFYLLLLSVGKVGQL
jgi:hypothetical protein